MNSKAIHLPFINKTALRYRYVLSNDKYSTTRHYQSTCPLNNDSFLTDKIRIAKNRGFNKSEATYLATLRHNNKWDKQILTGLFNTSKKNVFFGDIDKGKHFIVFVFPDKDKEIIIYIFPDYCPAQIDKKNEIINKIINQSL